MIKTRSDDIKKEKDRCRVSGKNRWRCQQNLLCKLPCLLESSCLFVSSSQRGDSPPGRLEFTVRRHKFNQDSLSRTCIESNGEEVLYMYI